MLDQLLTVILGVGLVCNLMALRVILRQDVKKVDLGLALIMALCDIAIVVYKLGEAIYISLTGDPWPKMDVGFGQWQGAGITFLLQLSTASVGYLALVRFWVIFLRWRLDYVKWWISFILFQVLLLASLVIVALKHQFVISHSMFMFFPDLNPKSWSLILCRYLLILSHLGSLIAVNVSYPCIAMQYKKDIKFLQLDRELTHRTRTINLKMCVLVILCNLVMLPAVFNLTWETFSNQNETPTMEGIAIVALISMTFANPLMMLSLHNETFIEFKDLVRRIKNWLPFRE